MDVITNLIEWVANDSTTVLVNLFPYLLLGLAALYVLWLVVGYLRVSQVAIEHDSRGRRRWPSLPGAADGAAASHCVASRTARSTASSTRSARATACRSESELLVACANCGATIRAADETCYRCGTRATLASVSEH